MVLLHSSLLVYYACADWEKERVLPARYVVSAVPATAQRFRWLKPFSSPSGPVTLLAVNLWTASSPSGMSFRAGSNSLSLWQEGRGGKLARRYTLLHANVHERWHRNTRRMRANCLSVGRKSFTSTVYSLNLRLLFIPWQNREEAYKLLQRCVWSCC